MKPILAVMLVSVASIGSSCGIPRAPRDANMIEVFEAERPEFEFWKDTLTKTQMNCSIDLDGSKLEVRGKPCSVEDEQRLMGFMRRAHLESVGSNGESRAVGFTVFAHGFKGSGAIKEYISRPTTPNPLVPSLDPYDSERAEEGNWYRKIGEGWYLRYYYSR